MARANRGGAAALDGAWRDLRLALRMLRRSPGPSSTIVLTLALGIGATAAIFSVVNGLLLRPLPVADPHRLVTISSDVALARGFTAGFGWTYPMWEALQPHLSLFGGAVAWTPARFDLADGGERQLVEGMFTSGGYFATLGIAAVRGRTFTATDDGGGGGPDGPVAVISHGLWQRRFAGADDVVGSSIVVDGVPVTIVGVAPPEFLGLDVGRAFDIALPFQAEPLIRGTRSSLRRARLVVMLRLKPSQSVEAGTAVLRTIQPQILGVSPDGMSRVTPAHNREPFTLVPAAAGTSLPVRGPTSLRQSYQRPLFTILAVALIVLVTACANIANLLLARGAARRRELSVRMALGASRGRLVWQLLMESFALAALGAVGGLAIARWGSGLLVAQLSTRADSIMLDLTLDWRVLMFTAVAATATAAIFGTLPAFRAVRIAPMDVLREGRGASQRAAGARPLRSVAGGLVILQIAFSLALVIAAALFVRSFTRLSNVPLGFDPDRVLVVNVGTDRVRTDPAGRLTLYQRIVEAAAAAPGATHAGGSMWTPIDGGMRMGDSQARIAFNVVTPGWFGAYGTRIRAGRDFTARDTNEAPPVAIVNQTFVRAHLGDRPPLGETIPYPRSRTTTAPRTIVGVVDDAVFDSQREGIQAIVYMPVAQWPGVASGGPAEISIGVRAAAGEPLQLAPSVAAALRSVDPDLSFSFRPLTDDVAASVRQEQVIARLSSVFGALALLIAVIGLYGMTSHSVTSRSAEIGIRMALGAQRADVLRLVLGQSLALSGAGICLGLAAAAAGTRYLRGMLFGLTPLDPATFAGVATLFAVTAVVAASFPAHRASRVDPMVTLRDE